MLIKGGKKAVLQVTLSLAPSHFIYKKNRLMFHQHLHSLQDLYHVPLGEILFLSICIILQYVLTS